MPEEDEIDSIGAHNFRPRSVSEPARIRELATAIMRKRRKAQ